jgi:hypothetical protein
MIMLVLLVVLLALVVLQLGLTIYLLVLQLSAMVEPSRRSDGTMTPVCALSTERDKKR